MSDISQVPGGALDPELDPLVGNQNNPDEIDQRIREDTGIDDEDIEGTVEED